MDNALGPPDPPRTVLITGGTGFVGSAVVRALSDHRLRILARHPRALTPEPEEIIGDVTDASSLTGVCDGVDALVHLVAIIEEEGKTTFDRVIRQGSENIIREAQRAGVKHVVFISALGAHDNAAYPYHQAKWRAEQFLQESGLSHTIFRPSIIFGPGDGFLSLLAGVVRAFPLTPVVGDGKALFQPIYIGDIAEIIAKAVAEPANMPTEPMELGGPEIVTFEELIDLIRRELQISRLKVHIPLRMMRLVVKASTPLPKTIRPPVTMEQLNMLQLGNSTTNSYTERLLGRRPRPLRGSLDYLRTSAGPRP